MCGGHMASAQSASLYEGLGRSPQLGPGAEPLVKPPPEAETLLGFGDQRKHQICFILRILQTPVLVIT